MSSGANRSDIVLIRGLVPVTGPLLATSFLNIHPKLSLDLPEAWANAPHWKSRMSPANNALVIITKGSSRTIGPPDGFSKKDTIDDGA
jgi:hypothetical protein